MVRISKSRIKREIPHSEILTLMMVDLCGYTALSTTLRRKTLDELHDIFDEIIIPCVEEHEGRIIKKIGDAFLATFKSPTNSLHCATELQKKFREHNKEHKLRKNPIKIKVALHTGEVIFKDKDIYGDAVNIVSRIESLTKPGHIVFSRSLFLTMNKNEIPCIYLGTKRIKGLKNPIKIFRVKPIGEHRFKTRKITFGLIKIIIIILIITLGTHFLLKLF